MSSTGIKCVECLDIEILDIRGRATRHAAVNWRRNLRIFEAALARNNSREQTKVDNLDPKVVSMLCREFRQTKDTWMASAARTRAGIDPIAYMITMAAGEKAHRSADGEGGSKPFPAERQTSFAGADEWVDRARGHIEAYDDPDDEMAKHERLGRAAECLRQAAESMRPKSGEQHFRMR